MEINFKRILILIMAVALLVMLPINSKIVYASEGGNGEGLNGGGSTQYIVNGPSANKQFWLVYITDENGSVKSPVVLIQNNNINYKS